jgi:rhamnose transport system substrate-binding protein
MLLTPARRPAYAAIALVAAATLALTACSSSASKAPTGGAGGASSTGGIKSGLKIAFLPKDVDNAYFVTSDTQGGKVAVGEFGGTYTESGPKSSDASQDQTSYIETATAQHVSAIVLSSSDPNKNCTDVAAAQAAGTKVVTFDSDTKPGCRDLFINQATADGIATAMLDALVDATGGTGEFVIVSSTATATNQNTWNTDITNALSQSKYAGLKLDKIYFGNDDAATSAQVTQQALAAFPNIKGIISDSAVGLPAVAREIATDGNKGKIAVTGLSTPALMIDYVTGKYADTVKSFVLWNPQNLGYLAAYAAAALSSGTITGKQGDTFTAGKLGSFTVGADNTVLLGAPTTFTSANICAFCTGGATTPPW